MKSKARLGLGATRSVVIRALPLLLALAVVLLLFGIVVDPATATEPRAARSMTDVAFVSSSTFFACGDGAIYKSATGGRSWVRQYARSGQFLRAIDFVDAHCGWAVGRGGLILSTTNGGRTWRRRSSNTKRDLVDVDFVDRLHGWAVGQPAIILGSTDGGRTWQRQLSEPASAYGYPEVVRFFSPSVGLVGGFCYGDWHWNQYRTVDGGRHWSPRIAGSEGVCVDIDLAGAAVCAVGYVPYEMGSYPPICVSSDRGESWEARSLPWPTALWDVELPDASTIYALGGSDLEAGVWLYRSTDGGIDWDRILLPVTASPVAMHFADSSRGTLVAASGATFVSTDRGSTWRQR